MIDGTVTQLALAALMLLPTVLACVFWPRVLAPMIRAIEPDGRRGMFLAPGTFFLISVLTSLLLAAVLLADSGGVMAKVGTDVSEAATEGQVWQVATMLLPLFLGATSLGLFAFVAGLLTRVPEWTVVAAVRSGFYALFALGVGVTFAEPLSSLVGDGGTNGVHEPTVTVVGALMMTWFFASLLSREAGWFRATVTGVLVSIPAAFILQIGYGGA